MGPTKITTLLFDCDNTLVMSEERAFIACATLANEMLGERGISDRYTGPQLLKEFVGQNFRGMILKLQEKYKFDISPKDLDTYVERELATVIDMLHGKVPDPDDAEKELGPVRSCDGVDEELEKLHKSGKYLMSVVSSSALPRVQASIEIAGQAKYFNPEHVYSAATSMEEPKSKPDKAIYVWAMLRLGEYVSGVKNQSLSPSECVAIEDSKSGATAAVAAGIKTVGYTGSYDDDEVEKMTQVLKDTGCVIIIHNWSEFPSCLRKIENGEV
ncbi:HAD-like domain-containing protein [Amylocarpus encephaloides]|uniref:HAD-like domain-containing protein n=1 Tax=Amylocarpus encephaloides TaxID=45428 RepID=A0A9P7YKX6_9HELO|nr:HAD-like domain-containing protein [Amylocarpus encephaloides]